MKNLLIIFTFIFSTCNAQNSYEIKLSYVDLDIMTPISVDCSNFDILFNSQIKTSTISNKSDIDSIVYFINKLKVDTSDYTPDVRVKLELRQQSKSQIYCLSKFSICHNNKSYFLPVNLIKIIEKHLK